jgi:hypothetical protein
MLGHRDFVRTPWGGYFIDLEEARRMGERWAEETLAKLRAALERKATRP